MTAKKKAAQKAKKTPRKKTARQKAGARKRLTPAKEQRGLEAIGLALNGIDDYSSDLLAGAPSVLERVPLSGVGRWVDFASRRERHQLCVGLDRGATALDGV